MRKLGSSFDPAPVVRPVRRPLRCASYFAAYQPDLPWFGVRADILTLSQDAQIASLTLSRRKGIRPHPASLRELVADRMQSNYKAVLLSRQSQEIDVVAEDIGTDIIPLVLAASAEGKFVWMKPH